MSRQPKGHPGNRRDLDTDTLDLFFKDLSKYPVLPADEQKELVIQAQAGDRTAREKVFQSNYRLLVRIAHEYGRTGTDTEDLIQEGFIGLDKAVDKYDTTKKVPFPNYAAWWIRKQMMRHLWWAQSTVRLPESQRSMIIDLMDLSSGFVAEHGRVPTEDELIDLSGYSEFMVHNYCTLFDYGSLKNTVPIDSIEESSMPEDTADNPETTTDAHLFGDAIARCLDTLPESGQEFLRDYYGIGRTAVPVSEMAKMAGTTTESIRQKRARLVNILRQNCAALLTPFADEIIHQ